MRESSEEGDKRNGVGRIHLCVLIRRRKEKNMLESSKKGYTRNGVCRIPLCVLIRSKNKGKKRSNAEESTA